MIIRLDSIFCNSLFKRSKRIFKFWLSLHQEIALNYWGFRLTVRGDADSWELFLYWLIETLLASLLRNPFVDCTLYSADRITINVVSAAIEYLQGPSSHNFLFWFIAMSKSWLKNVIFAVENILHRNFCFSLFHLLCRQDESHISVIGTLLVKGCRSLSYIRR